MPSTRTQRCAPSALADSERTACAASRGDGGSVYPRRLPAHQPVIVVKVIATCPVVAGLHRVRHDSGGAAAYGCSE